jgi:Na+-driven multidrug efflux pump
MGNEAVAVTTITSTVENLALVFFFGICSAAAVILGNEMGANRLKEAEEHAKRYMVLVLMLTILGAILTLIIKEPVIKLFGMPEEVNSYIRICLTAFAVYMPIRMLNCLIIVAILRSGGDTKAALFLDVSSVWLIGVPMAFLGGLVFKFPVYIVYIMIATEEFYKITLGLLRYKKKKWLKNIVS